VIRRFCILLLFLNFAFLSELSSAQSPTPGSVGHTLVVMPFENASRAPGLEWISEAFPEILGQRLASPTLYVVSRNERLRAYDRAGIPVGVHPSRATVYRVAEQMDVDYVVLGQYNYDGSTFTATAQLLDMRREKLLTPLTESGLLIQLIQIQTGLAWDLLRGLRPDMSTGREAYLAAFPPIRLDAFENYVRGIMATTAPDKLSHFREAVRIHQSYNEAWLALGKSYFDQRRYSEAISALGQVPQTTAVAREANFYIGLAAYYLGNFDKAESAFNFVAETLPLPEIYNNLGVVERRRSKKNAIDFFQRALQADPNDADYHFNLGLALYSAGDLNAASKQFRETIALRPGDAEAKSIYERISRDPTVQTAAKTLTNASNRIPVERVKRNYDEDSFRQLAWQIQAIAEQRLAKADRHSHARFHVGRGDELLSQGFSLEAEKEFREAISLDAGNAHGYAGLARVLESNGDAAGARSQAQAALLIRQFADPLLVIARLDLRDNRTEAAAENVNKALQLEPSNASAQALKRAVAAKLAEKAQPLPNP